MVTANKNLLAELIGITLGDGELFNCPRCQRLRIYCNIYETQYIGEVEKIIYQLFHKKPYTYQQAYKSETYVEVHKKGLNQFLGLPSGDKIRNKATIPTWIFQNKTFIKNCLRGLFDTDGCCYILANRYPIINFCSKNPQLLTRIKKAFILLGYNPYQTTNRIELGKQKEIKKFFQEIKPRNEKHHHRYNLFAGVVKAVTTDV